MPVIAPSDVTIGADPELVVVHPKTGMPLRVNNYVGGGEFGADGHGYIAELRPLAAITPDQLTKNVQRCLMGAPPMIKTLPWQAGPWVGTKPCGGHIHFGVPLSDDIMIAFDSIMPILLAVIEPAEQARKRRTTPLAIAGTRPGARGDAVRFNNAGKPYGLLGDFKTKPYGFEWRTPASFIVSPGVATGVFALSKGVLYEQLIKGKSSWAKLPPRIRKGLKFTPDQFYKCDRAFFLPLWDNLWPLFKQLKYFSPGCEGHSLWSTVTYLKRFAAAKDGFRIYKDIKTKWKIEPPPNDEYRFPDEEFAPTEQDLPPNPEAEVPGRAPQQPGPWGFRQEDRAIAMPDNTTAADTVTVTGRAGFDDILWFVNTDATGNQFHLRPEHIRALWTTLENTTGGTP